MTMREYDAVWHHAQLTAVANVLNSIREGEHHEPWFSLAELNQVRCIIANWREKIDPEVRIDQMEVEVNDGDSH